MSLFVCTLSIILKFSKSGSFQTIGNKIYYDSNWITFNGIGLTCTEYMMKPNIDSKNPYKGWWAYNSCFGGPSSAKGPIELNKEPQNVLNYLSGSNFIRNPNINKIKFESPFNQVIDTDSPQHFPIIRIPMAGSCYLYDEDVDSGNHMDYVNTIDAIVQFFTNNNVAVILDLHWNCPDDTAISGCAGAQSVPMALAKFGSNPGAVAFWDAVSKRYANNSLVIYELFNEPWMQPTDFPVYYGGSSKYAGMKQMYDAIRVNDATGLIVIGGAQGYALDAQTLLAFWIQFGIDKSGKYPTNIIFNHHPYQGGGQGLEHSLQSVMRFSLASKTVAPVIFTEFGQYCCGIKGNSCTGGNECKDHDTGDNFVFNIVNYALQYDISFIGWAWRGTNDDNPCGSKPDCHQPDMRNENGMIVNGTYAGANWDNVWNSFVNKESLNVMDATNGRQLASNEPEISGYLVRPCIEGDYNTGDICGWDLNTNITSLTVNDFISQSMYDSILVGLPPFGNCRLQGCTPNVCKNYTGPCH
eukprot:260266_1